MNFKKTMYKAIKACDSDSKFLFSVTEVVPSGENRKPKIDHFIKASNRNEAEEIIRRKFNVPNSVKLSVSRQAFI